jgi:methyl-accepting chemotaxis protein
MKNIKIGTKLIVSFLLASALTVFVGLYLENSLKTVDENADELFDKGIVPLGQLIDVSDWIQEIRVQAMYWRIAKTDEDRAKAWKTIDSVEFVLADLLKKQKERLLTEGGKKLVDDVQMKINKYVAEVENYFTTTTTRCPLSGMTEVDFPPSVRKAGAEMRDAVDSLTTMKIAATTKLDEENSATAHNAERLSRIILIASVIFSICIGIFLTFSITGPLKKVVNALSKIESGDMTARVGLERKDELGTVSKALDSLSSKLQTIFKNLHVSSDTLAGSAEELSNISRQLASGAEEASAKTMSVSSAIEEVSVNVKSIASTAEESAANVMDVSSSVEQVAVNINAMAGGAEESSVNANEVAGAAEQMSTNMSTIAAAIEEMSASISQISGNANEARSVANEATVKSGNATEAMNKLGDAANEIGQVTDVIKKIADKTNLLALNATIEAASAGAAGKGFAVVAGEIKDLANQSALSADDIARRIKGIQTGTDQAVKVIIGVSEIIEKIHHSVESISSHVGQQTKASNEIANNVAQANIGVKRVAESMSEVAKGSKDMARNASQASIGAKHVAESIGEVAKGSKDIARNASEAAKGASEVSQNVLGVNQVTKESAQGAGQINQGADELARLAGDLKNVLSQFKV